MTITKAKQLRSQLGMQQCYELCNDWLDEQDFLQSKIKIPELTFQAICKGCHSSMVCKKRLMQCLQ
ncbi:hypothetical protein BIY40_00215 [Pediococcus acidilactici]|nr:hypothetical protein BIY40_00215 [Pediococcus acidilactici]